MITIYCNLYNRWNPVVVYENIAGMYWIESMMKKYNRECRIIICSRINRLCPNILESKYVDQEPAFDTKQKIIYLLNPTNDDIMRMEKNTIYEVYFNIIDFQVYNHFMKLDLIKLFKKYRRDNRYADQNIIYLNTLENIEQIITNMNNQTILLINRPDDTVVVGDNRTNTISWNTELLITFYDRCKKLFTDHRIQTAQYADHSIDQMISCRHLMIDLTRKTVWIYMIRNQLKLPTTIKCDYLGISSDYIEKNIHMPHHIRIIFDPSKTDGLGTIIHELMALTDHYDGRPIYLLDDFVPAHETKHTLGYLFPNLQFVNRKIANHVISIFYHIPFSAMVDQYPDMTNYYGDVDVILTGTNYRFPELKYLDNINQYRQMFAINPLIIDEINKKYSELLNSKKQKTAVHIRRGDLIELLKKNKGTHACIASMEYYQQSIGLFPNTDMYFFTEDKESQEYAQKIISVMNLEKSGHIIPLDHGLIHLYMISCCDNLIMAPSTFSFLGYIFAQMYHNRSVRIVAPKYFLNPQASKNRYLEQKTTNILLALEKEHAVIIDPQCNKEFS